MHTLGPCGKYVLAGVAALAALASLGTAHAAAITVLYAFAGGNDGTFPNGLIKDSAGNLYGTTYEGGGTGCYPVGCGTVFKLAPDGTKTVLYDFTDENGDGAWPDGSLIRDSAGNLYGTTVQGGAGCNCGTVFKLAPDGTETVLHAFHGGDGGFPLGSLIRDRHGNLYGTASAGGDECEYRNSCGTVYKLAPDGTETVLHYFSGGSDGANPVAGLIRDRAGNFYGTTYQGGAADFGTVFKLAPDGTETVLYAFSGGSDGSLPGANLIEDNAGNLYSTTVIGGAHANGTVFKLAPDGTETVLYSFTGGRDGANPSAGLIEDKAGNFYSTTAFGGNLTGWACKTYGCGTVFKFVPDGTETVLHAFHGRKDGWLSQAGLIEDGSGKLYGTTEFGGTQCRKGGCGIIFRLRK